MGVIKMSLFNMQRLLGKILTDEQLRNNFLKDPKRVFDGYELTQREMESLRNLDAERLIFYTSGINRHRIDVAFKAFPLTKFLVSDEIKQFVATYCQEFPPTLDSAVPALREHIRFHQFLVRLIADGKLRSKYLEDILEYEKNLFFIGNSVEASHSASEFARANRMLPGDFTMDLIWNLKPAGGVHVEASSFTYDVIELASYLSGREVPELGPKATHLLFSKIPNELGVRTSKINKATLDLISFCDGARTTGAVLSKLACANDSEIERGGAELAATCLPIFRQLCKFAVITFKQ
jgi:hypothetical protein